MSNRKIVTYEGKDVETMTKAQMITAFKSLAKTINNYSRIKIGTVVDEELYQEQIK